METNLKKLLPILGVVCFSMASLSAAAYNNNDDGNDKMMKSAVPPAKNAGDNGPVCFISADYTYWTARQDGLFLGSDNNYGTAVASPVQGSAFYPKWYGNSGFKVALGAFLNHDGWDLGAEYTWFSNQNNPLLTTTITTAGQGLLAFTGASTNSFTTLTSQWSNYFNRIDLDMGRSYWSGHYLTLRPFAGLMGAWETQNLDVRSAATAGATNQIFQARQQWWGVGPYAGVDTMFVFPTMLDANTNQFGIFLNSGFAMPWSQYKVTTTTQTNAAGQPYEYSSLNTYYTSTPMVEMSLGLAWESWWNDHSWCFALSAAWENQLYFAHNQIFDPTDAFGQAGGNMILQGLTVKAYFAF